MVSLNFILIIIRDTLHFHNFRETFKLSANNVVNTYSKIAKNNGALNSLDCTASSSCYCVSTIAARITSTVH